MIQTDENRASNFDSLVNGRPLHDALAELLAKVKKQAYADATPPITEPEAADMEGQRSPVVWRAPRAQSPRATATWRQRPPKVMGKRLRRLTRP